QPRDAGRETVADRDLLEPDVGAILDEAAGHLTGAGAAEGAGARLVGHVARLPPAVTDVAELVVIVVTAVVGEDAHGVEDLAAVAELEDGAQVEALERQLVGETAPEIRVRAADDLPVGGRDPP